MNIQMDKKTIVVGLIALVVGAGIATVHAHRDFYERFEHGGDRGGWNAEQRGVNTQNGNRTGMMNGDNMRGTTDTMMGGLEGKTGDALDRAFIDEMIVHHQGAIDMANTLLKGTKRPELIKLANDIIAAQTKEIEQMKAWRAAWFSATSTPAQ